MTSDLAHLNTASDSDNSSNSSSLGVNTPFHQITYKNISSTKRQELLVFGYLRLYTSKTKKKSFLPTDISLIILQYFPLIFDLKWSSIFKGSDLSIIENSTDSTSAIFPIKVLVLTGGNFDGQSIRSQQGIAPGMIIKLKFTANLKYFTRNFFGCTNDCKPKYYEKGADDGGGIRNAWGIDNYSSFIYRGRRHRCVQSGGSVIFTSMPADKEFSFVMELDYKTYLPNAALSYWMEDNLLVMNYAKNKSYSIKLPDIINNKYHDERVEKVDKSAKKCDDDGDLWYIAMSLCRSGTWCTAQLLD